MTPEQLHRLNFHLLLEVRELARETDGKTFRLVDCFHNLPMQLLSLSKGKSTPSQIESDLRERAASFGLDKWLENQIENNL